MALQIPAFEVMILRSPGRRFWRAGDFHICRADSVHIHMVTIHEPAFFILLTEQFPASVNDENDA